MGRTNVMLLQGPRVALSCATELTATDILNVAIPFDDCAKCCDNDYNSPGQCFRRRRLLSDSLEEPKTVDDCAKECILLNIESGQLIEGDDQCKAFRVGKDGTCKLATMCHVFDQLSDEGPAVYFKVPGLDMY